MLPLLASMNASPRESQKTLLLKAITLALVCSYILASLAPIYGDEVVYSIISGRFGLDGRRRLYIHPECLSSFAISVPISWYLPLYLLEGLYFPLTHPFFLRLFGLSCAAGNLFCLRYLFKVGNQDDHNRLLFLVSALSLGIFPFFAVYARPEGLCLLFLLTSLALTKKYNSQLTRSYLSDVCVATTNVFLALMAFVVHPVGLSLMPLFIYSNWVASKRMAFALSSSLICLYLGFESYLTHALILSCPESLWISTFYSVYGSSINALQSPTSFIVQLFVNSATLWSHVLSSIIHYDNYVFGLIPSIYPVSSNLLILFNVTVIALFFLVFSLGLLSLIVNLSSRRSSKNLCFLVASLLALFLFAGQQAIKFPYRIVLAYPLILLAIGPTFNSSYLKPLIPNIGRVMQVLGLLAIINSTIVVVFYFVPIVQTLTSRNIHSQPCSFGLFAFEKNHQAIEAARVQCGITNPSSQQRLIVDTLTYSAVRGFREPIVIDYFLAEANNRYENLETLMQDIESSALFVFCDHYSLPKRFRDQATKIGEICCFSRP